MSIPSGPKRARDFARCTGRIAKTDAIDANMLAAMAQTLKPPVHAPLCKEREVLHDLHTRRDQLVAMRAQETTRLELLANASIVKAIERHIAQLSDDIKSIYADYIANNGEAGSKTAGKFRLEGKEYVVYDGDVMYFRFNT